MIEIEAKFRIEDPQIIRDRLSSIKAKWIGKRFELNAFFDTIDSKLKNANEGLRLRTIRDESTGRSTGVITFKGKPLAGPIKQREEIEFGIDDFDRASDLLSKLGFIPTLAFEKRREIWNLNDCEIVIDELPMLGHFVEIEGPSVESVESMIWTVELSEHKRIRQGYATIIAEEIRAGRARGPVVMF